MRSRFPRLLFAAVSSAAARAATPTLAHDPVAAIARPDAWNPQETPAGVDAAVAASAAAPAGPAETAVVPDPATIPSERRRLGAPAAATTRFAGGDPVRQAGVRILAVARTPADVLAVTPWGTGGRAEAHRAKVDAPIGSIRPARRAGSVAGLSGEGAGTPGRPAFTALRPAPARAFRR